MKKLKGNIYFDPNTGYRSKMKKISAQDIKGLEEKIAKTCGFDVEDVPRLADDCLYMDENQELFTIAEDGTDDMLPLGFTLKDPDYFLKLREKE